MNPTNSPVVHTVQVPPEGLAAFYNSLREALLRSGLEETHLDEVFVKNIQAECVLCGLRLTSAELGLLAASDRQEPPNSKLAQLSLGYCARVGCKSRFYTVQLAEHPLAHWPTLLAQALPAPPPSEAPPSPSVLQLTFKRLDRKTLVRLAAGVAVILACFFIRHVMNGGRIPILQPKHTYSLDPGTAKPPGGLEH